MGRLVRYNVAMSLDGFIAPPDESTGWIVEDSSIDFAGLYDEFDFFIMGRKTYDVMRGMGPQNPLIGRSKDSVIVISRTLQPGDHPDVTIISDGFIERIASLKGQDGRDVWIMGGGWLAAACLDAGLLDVMEMAIMPVLLRDGFKLMSAETGGAPFRLVAKSAQRLQTGILMTAYNVEYTRK
ncbi:dihydrofolate reductase-like domain-containing protein [Stachybotrys elegans]|uniref:2,5-diamino-6-ribosylamino-4(3H)-pyrimidinone 5'-phosphate reductase n=1 Tax=Stachybotrys elegans TaxID=80388 RepID=A0A8K0SX64_9HYPO|nr:dihydrofolate reductase-like domain-containing protein [Stachybotrys elegans]